MNTLKMLARHYLSRVTRVRQQHPIYADMLEATKKFPSGPFRMEMYSKRQRLYKNFSIISPAGMTQNLYEAYDGNETYRCKTLKAAKERCTQEHFKK